MADQQDGGRVRVAEARITGMDESPAWDYVARAICPLAAPLTPDPPAPGDPRDPGDARAREALAALFIRVAHAGSVHLSHQDLFALAKGAEALAGTTWVELFNRSLRYQRGSS